MHTYSIFIKNNKIILKLVQIIHTKTKKSNQNQKYILK